MPHRTIVSRQIENDFIKGKEEVVNDLAKVDHVSSTSDIWHHSGQNLDYLGVTVHYEKDEKLVSCTLATKVLEERKTIPVLKKALDSIYSDFLIKPKLSCLTTDGGTNIAGAAKQLTEWFHCIAHRFNLCLTDLLDNVEFKTFVDLASSLVTKLKTVLSRDLRQIQRSLKKKN